MPRTISPTLANQRTGGGPRKFVLMILRREGRLHSRFSDIIGQAHPIKLFDLDITPET